MIGPIEVRIMARSMGFAMILIAPIIAGLQGSGLDFPSG
jgi:hypothetical protein